MSNVVYLKVDNVFKRGKALQINYNCESINSETAIIVARSVLSVGASSKDEDVVWT